MVDPAGFEPATDRL